MKNTFARRVRRFTCLDCMGDGHREYKGKSTHGCREFRADDVCMTCKGSGTVGPWFDRNGRSS